MCRTEKGEPAPEHETLGVQPLGCGYGGWNSWVLVGVIGVVGVVPTEGYSTTREYAVTSVDKSETGNAKSQPEGGGAGLEGCLLPPNESTALRSVQFGAAPPGAWGNAFLHRVPRSYPVFPGSSGGLEFQQQFLASTSSWGSVTTCQMVCTSRFVC